MAAAAKKKRTSVIHFPSGILDPEDEKRAEAQERIARKTGYQPRPASASYVNPHFVRDGEIRVVKSDIPQEEFEIDCGEKKTKEKYIPKCKSLDDPASLFLAGENQPRPASAKTVRFDKSPAKKLNNKTEPETMNTWQQFHNINTSSDEHSTETGSTTSISDVSIPKPEPTTKNTHLSPNINLTKLGSSFDSQVSLISEDSSISIRSLEANFPAARPDHLNLQRAPSRFETPEPQMLNEEPPILIDRGFCCQGYPRIALHSLMNDSQDIVGVVMHCDEKNVIVKQGHGFDIPDLQYLNNLVQKSPDASTAEVELAKAGIHWDFTTRCYYIKRKLWVRASIAFKSIFYLGFNLLCFPMCFRLLARRHSLSSAFRNPEDWKFFQARLDYITPKRTLEVATLDEIYQKTIYESLDAS